MVLLDSRSQASQWDYGLYVLFSNDDGVVAGQEVHFASQGDGVASVVLAESTTDGIVCAIPNQLLTDSRTIRIYAYVDDGETGRTVKRWQLPVFARPRPDDYVFEETEVRRYETLAAELATEASIRAADDRALSNRITVATNVARGKLDNPTGGTAGQVLTKTETGQDWQTPSGYIKPSGGIPKSDLAAAVRASLGKADTATQIPTIEADTLTDVLNEMDEDTCPTAIAGFSGFYLNDNGTRVNYTEPKQVVQLYDPDVGITYGLICTATGRRYYFDAQMTPRMKYTADEAIPETLPSPQALTFTGAVSATYDGSSAVTVNIPQGGGGSGAVSSVNGHTGAVVLSASDVGALPDSTVIPSAYDDTEVRGLISAKYSKPSSGIPKTDLASAVRTSLGKADSALQSLPTHSHAQSDITGLSTALNAKLTTPSGGTDGQVLTKTASGYAWQTPSGGGECNIPIIAGQSFVEAYNNLIDTTNYVAICSDINDYYYTFDSTGNITQHDVLEMPQVVNLYDLQTDDVSYIGVVFTAVGHIYYWDSDTENPIVMRKYVADEALEGLATLATQIDEDIGL